MSVQTMITQALTSPQAKATYSDALSEGAAKFVKTPEGKEVIAEVKSTVSWYAVVPTAVVAFTAGFLIARRMKG